MTLAARSRRDCDAPDARAGRMAKRSVTGFVDLVADDAADDCPADRANRAAAGEDGTSDSPHASANGCALVLRRHPGTSTQAEQHGCCNCIERESLYGFHGTTSSVSNVLRSVLGGLFVGRRVRIRGPHRHAADEARSLARMVELSERLDHRLSADAHKQYSLL
ncbi:hypothetical protein ACCAA_130120 [Candidatus Accumulibacter aalborgensis]|uniref:Uncharacterized protein n=1 Tax=Candidatus Accumulibacter aalborgensis TaxID=1860102 RepID=A0A1A8XG60_9PROT|nr:hypothetical protein ACCAA_130120 [Candidatus Accumulibacter aalborgensis]